MCRKNTASSSGLVPVLEEEVVAVELLLLVELGIGLIDTGTVVDRITAESDVEVIEEGVASGEQRLGLVCVGIDAGLAIEDDDAIGQVRSHDEIVLDDECGLLCVHDESLDYACSNDTLLGVQVGGRLIDQVDVGGHTQGQHDGNTLKFTTGQMLDFLVDEVVQLQGLHNIGLELRRQDW